MTREQPPAPDPPDYRCARPVKPPAGTEVSPFLSDPLGWLQALDEQRLLFLVGQPAEARAKVPRFTRGRGENRVDVCANVCDALAEYGEAGMVEVCRHAWKAALDGPHSEERSRNLACTFSGGGGGWGIRAAAYAKAQARPRALANPPEPEPTAEALEARVELAKRMEELVKMKTLGGAQ